MCVYGSCAVLVAEVWAPPALPIKANELPGLNFKDLSEGNEGREVRVHGLARVGLALLKLLIGERGDARVKRYVFLRVVPPKA